MTTINITSSMASVLRFKLPISHPPNSSSSSTTSSPSLKPLVSCFKQFQQTNLTSLSKKLIICRASLDDASVAYAPQSANLKPKKIASLKLNLLSTVSGLNRGLAASEEDLRNADSSAKELEEIGGPVDLSEDLDKLQGRWKLIYSSAFSSRTLGGSRPGPPIGRLLPITLGQVFQRIDIFSKDFDNIVELELGAPWPLPPVEVTATLAHKFELIGSSKINIKFEKTTVKTSGNLSQLPPFEIPKIPDGLRPPSNTGTGEFEVTYLDTEMRITRGDRGELRVFVVA